jgi:hypothetical protein
MKTSASWVLVLSLCSFNAVSAMKCGHKLVELGDYKGDVLALCGEPESIENRTKIVGSTLHHPRRTLDLQQYEEVKIEEWIYNFGSYRLQQYLRFENGVLKEIKSLGRGH